MNQDRLTGDEIRWSEVKRKESPKVSTEYSHSCCVPQSLGGGRRVGESPDQHHSFVLPFSFIFS